MALGPVFHAELLTTARRRRYYIARLVYGLTLLALVGWTYEEKHWITFTRNPSPVNFSFLAETAAAIFAAFITAQVAAVLVFTPAMVAGTIADESQRKTLHYLLASQLTSLEIVGGKLAARMLQIVVLVLVGLPILSILSLFGGLDPPLVLAAVGGTLTTGFALASLSILISALNRRARDAILLAYGAEAALLSLPFLLSMAVGPSSPAWLAEINTAMRRIDPFQLAQLANPAPGLARNLLWMGGLQVAIGLVFVAIAVWRLRPVHASDPRTRSAGPTGRARWFGRRPDVGDDPMLWKERHIARLGPFLGTIGFLVGVFTVVFVGDVLLDVGRAAIVELRRFGYGDALMGVEHTARNELNEFLALVAMIAYVVWTVVLGSTTAAGISSEREDDTWLSLLATSLSGGEILRAKALGALWRWRWVGLLAVGLWTFGLLAGAIHPLGYVLTILEFVVFSAFALALGLFFSIRSKSTARAIVATVGILFVLNLGYLLLLFPLGNRVDAFWFAGCTPYVVLCSAARYDSVQIAFGQFPASPSQGFAAVLTSFLTCGLSLLGYSVATVIIAGATVNDFDRAVDRPRRRRNRSLEFINDPEIDPS